MGATYNQKILELYGDDPRELPLYGLSESARYLKIHTNTLRSWIHGRSYEVESGAKKWWPPVIKLPDADKPLLSFYNLIELHVLSGIRRIHNIRFNKVRTTLSYLERNFESNHPLATNDFWTDKFDVFIEEAGSLICASMDGQLVIKEVVDKYLHRIERHDLDLTPLRLYPFSREIKMASSNSDKKLIVLESMPKTIVIDPLVAFGRPTISGTGVQTNVIAGRFRAGEDIRELSEDYEIEEVQIKDALTYEGISIAA